MNGPPPRLSASPGRSHDDFAAAIVQNLNRSLDERYEWGAFRTLLWGGLSFGLLPAVIWSVRFRDYVAAERRQLAQVAEWVRYHSIHAEAGALRHAADELDPRPFLSALPLILVLLLIGIFGMHFSATDRFNLNNLLLFTYGYSSGRGHVLPSDLADARRLSLFWTVFVGAAYVCHWMQVRLHVGDVQRFLARFDRVAVAEGLAPVPLPRQWQRRRLRWVIGAAILSGLGAFWGIAAMLAGAAQRRYVNFTGPALREALAERVRCMLMPRVPSAAVPIATHCSRDRCRAPVVAGARFCRRCGAEVVASNSAHA